MTTTLEEAGKWVAEARGKQWPQDRVEVIHMVNDIRELLYDDSAITWQTTLCAPVRTLCGECDTCGPFSGLSLPAFVSNVLGVQSAGRPVPVVDRWGIYPYDDTGVTPYKFVDLGEEYPFLNDPPCGGCYKLRLLAKSRADVGKTVTLRYLDANNLERTEVLTLSNLPVETQYSIKGIARNGVSLPSGLTGAISAKSDDGTLLAEWQPWELVPGYRRLRLDSCACRVGCMVVVHVERRRYKLCALTDPVEMDKKLAWQDGARYLYLHNKTNADQGDLANEAKFFASFRAKLEEEAKRLRGRTHKRALQFTSNLPRRSGLMRGR